MTKEMQLEEMANAYYEAMLKARGTLGSMNEGAPKWYAREFYNAGYRKASTVAEEIFAEIDRMIYNLLNDRHYIVGDMCYEVAELKKKYTGKGEGK